MIIRRACFADRMRVLLMARAFHAAADLPFPFSAPHADAIFRASIAQDDRFCIVLDIGGAAHGVLAAQAGDHPFGAFRFASELIWWIEPDHRGRAAPRMIAEYEAWAKARGCLFAELVGLGAEPATGPLYRRCGYGAAERHYLKLL